MQSDFKIRYGNQGRNFPEEFIMRHNLIDFLREFVQKRRNILLLAFLIGILSIGIMFGFSYQGMMPRELNKLIITGHEKLKTEEIVRMLEIQPGTSFDTLDLDLLEKRLSRLPRVNSARITKKYGRSITHRTHGKKGHIRRKLKRASLRGRFGITTSF